MSIRNDILIIDDQPDNLYLLTELLSKEGYKIRRSTNGSHALNAAQLVPPDLILLDIVMPDIDGYAICQQLKADPRTQAIPVIFLSALDDVSNKVKAFASGGVDYIIKPFQKDEVLARVRTHLQIQNLTTNLKTQNALLKEEVEQRKALEIILRRQALIFESIHDGVIVIDLVGKIVDCNAAAERMFGYTKAEMLTQTPTNLYQSEEANSSIKQIVVAIQQQSEWSGEISFIRKDGHGGICETSVVPLIDHSRQGIGTAVVNHDITERKHIEAQLRLFESIVVNANDAILVTEAETIDRPGPRIIYVNDAFTRMTGYTYDEVKDKTPRILQGPKTERAKLDIIRKALESWQPARIELVNYRKDGSESWVDLNILPVADKTGRFTHWISIQREITERKLYEIALQESEEKFRQLAENLREVFWVAELSLVDPVQHRLIYISPAYETVWQRSCEDLYRNPSAWMATIHPDDRETIEQHFFQDILKGGFDNEYRIIRPDGSIRWIRERGVPVKLNHLSNPEVCRVTGIAEDITDRKRAEQQLRESEYRFSTLAKAAPVGIFRTDPEGNCIYVNPRWCELTGLTPESALGPGWAKALHPEDRDRVFTQWIKSAQTNQPFTEEYRFQHSDEQVVWVYGQALAERDIHGRIVGYLGTLTDLTERRNIETMRLALQKEREMSGLKLRFFSMASHEFRTPLSVILLSAQILENSNSQGLDAKSLRNIQRIQRSAQNMRQMLTDVLTLARVETQQTKLQLKRLNLKKVCDRILRDFQTDLDKAVKLEFVYDGDESLIMLDENLIVSMFTNLISNAIKYSEEGVVLMTVHLTSDNIIVKVKDQGIGIPVADQTYIFDAFYRASNVGKHQGTGLGLAIVKKSVELHNGYIELESQPGSGSCFTIYLPCHLTQQN